MTIHVCSHRTKETKLFPDSKLRWICEQVASDTGKPANQDEATRALMYRRKILDGHVIKAGGFDVWRTD